MRFAERRNAVAMFQSFVAAGYPPEAAREQVEIITRKTQNPVTALEESPFIDNVKSQAAWSLLFLFHGQPNIIRNQVTGAYAEAQMANTPEARRAAHRQLAAVTATATVNVPASCTMGFPCSAVQTLAQMYLPGATCANAAGGGCDCTATRTTNFNDVAAFTNAGGVLTMADGGTYVSCVSPATTLKYTRPDGGVLPQLLVGLLQRTTRPVDPKAPGGPTMSFEGGSTIIADLREQKVRYCIRKRLSSASRLGDQRKFALTDFDSLHATYLGERALDGALRERELLAREQFALLHREP